MTDAFTRIRGRAATVIAKFGAPILFFTEGTPAHQASDGSWIEAQSGLSFSGVAIETRGDPNQIFGTGSLATLDLSNSVVVLVASQDPATGAPMLGIPTPKLSMQWPYSPSNAAIGVNYIISRVSAIAPNGNAIYYAVVGDVV